MLDDGTSGMWAIKRSSGICIVQDPNQAEYPDMPLSVINNMDVDYVSELHLRHLSPDCRTTTQECRIGH
ncbi:hypothetical protein GCM10007423_01060 [Dyadobacter endophyticus]|uniref:CheB-type methylesterase domain-containing protein n=1 Tax=Dyadobacter endophyticus TaxID=1749036 RepID=A0ABQ1YDE1_9BACT|nr:chemotaxis protein CheB [Dyadobacter endophyticus]GGH20585.1 hypothetical protein GCM10007423_01060 [Dyadobacter endophyticus]